jgi:lysozyme
MLDRDQLRRDLIRDEGVVPHAYQDSLGYWTIGVGRLIDRRKGGGLSDDEIALLLDNDIARKLAALEPLPVWQAVKDDPVRARAIANMVFQLGPREFQRGGLTVQALIAKDWATAARRLRGWLWARQTPARAQRIIAMIETGKDPQ